MVTATKNKKHTRNSKQTKTFLDGKLEDDPVYRMLVFLEDYKKDFIPIRLIPDFFQTYTPKDAIKALKQGTMSIGLYKELYDHRKFIRDEFKKWDNPFAYKAKKRDLSAELRKLEEAIE